VIELDPEFVEAYNGLAWLYATAKDSSVRNGSVAVNLAKKSIKFSKQRVNLGGRLDTLAAAYVEAGKLEQAFKTYERVMKLDSFFVLEYQKYLKNKGHYKDKIDGVYSTAMRNSLIACVRKGCQLGVD